MSSIASPLVPRNRRGVVIQDWRHRTRPEEFGWAQRAYRRLWNLSIATAGLTIATSTKTARETTRFAKPRRLEIVRIGEDHSRKWQPVPDGTERQPGLVVTYGHLRNKRPELAIDAAARVAREGVTIRLVVLGATGRHRAELAERAQRLDVADDVEFPGFVDTPTYQRLVQTAQAVLLVSSDEGFGIPVAEAKYFGTPVIVASDGGLPELHDGVIVVEPDAANLGERIAEVLRDSHQPPAPRTEMQRWSDVVTATRELLRQSD